jgi:hypothetical protein
MLYTQSTPRHSACQALAMPSYTPTVPVPSDTQHQNDDERRAWDQRLTDALAHDAWLAANHPADRPREPPLRERIRSPWFWMALVAIAGLTCVRALANVHGLASASLWVGSLIFLYGALRIEARVGSPR